MEKLKILIVARGTLTNVLGTLKVHYELKEEYERQGHQVDVLDYSIIYPNGINVFTKIFGELDTIKFWRYLKQNAKKYDVIDANSECVVYPKESFGFGGVLLVRSHGIRPVYDDAMKIESYRKELVIENTNVKFKTKIGNIYRYIQKKPGLKEFEASVKYADLVHCLNNQEYEYFLNHGVSIKKLLLIPNALSDNLINSLNKETATNKTNSICFIGSWTIRKGIKDINSILIFIRKHIDIERFFLLGGYYEKDYTKKDFDNTNQNILKIIPNFEPNELPKLIKNCKVGLFPSYVEGFPLAVVEQLACGIPVVAYRVPGPTDILENLDKTLLIEPGDKEGFAYKVIQILKLDDTEFQVLSQRCILESRKYLLSDISHRFLDAYLTILNSKNNFKKIL